MIVLSNPIPMPPEAAAAADPVFALIEEHRTAYAEWDRLSKVYNSMPMGGPGYEEAEAASEGPSQREVTAYETLFSACPTTFAGMQALAKYLCEAVNRNSINGEETDSERALRTIAAAMATLAPAAPSPAEPDPIFGAIAAYRAAWDAVEAASEAEAADSAGTALSTAYRHLRTTRPTTPAGYAALADHLAWHLEQEPSYGNTTGEQVAVMLIAGRSALRCAPPPAGPSPELLAMIGEWEAIGRRIASEANDERVESLSSQHIALQMAIYRWPASSIAELAAKAPVFRDEMEDAVGCLADGVDPADSLGGAAWLGLMRDLASLSQAAPAGWPDPDPVFVAIEASRRAEAERPKPTMPCASAPMAPGETPTLSAMSIGELADLYDAGLLASQQPTALASVPASSGEDRVQLRILLDLEADRFGDLTMDCAEELKSRLPATDEERADRVSILAKHAARFHAWADLAALATAEASASAGGRL